MKTVQLPYINIKRLAPALLLAAGLSLLLGWASAERKGERLAETPVSAVETEPVAFLADYGQARNASAATGKPLLLLFTEPGSPFSQRVDREIFGDPGVAALCGNFICASVDTGNPAAAEIVKKFRVTASPTVILTAAHGGASLQITQFRSAAEFKEQMKTILRPVAWQQASAFLR